MSDSIEDEKPFCVDRAKLGRATCKNCKEKCAKGDLRLAKLTASPYGEGKMKNWFHLHCIFEQFLKQRPTTKRLQNSTELDGWELLSSEDKESIASIFEEYEKKIAEKNHLDYVPKKFEENLVESPKTNAENMKNLKDVTKNNKTASPNAKSKELFREFRRLVANITNVSSYNEKTQEIEKTFAKNNFSIENKKLWCRLLLPGVIKRIYNLQSKQLVKIFSKILSTDQEEMLMHLKQGDVAETIQDFFEKSPKYQPNKKSLLTVKEVDHFLENLSKLTKEEDQMQHFQKIMPKCTANDLKMIVRLIKHDLRMNAGAKHVLDAVHNEAYQMYQNSRNLESVIDRCLANQTTSTMKNHSNEVNKPNKEIILLTPVLPMLAEPCKSIEQAMKRCPNGMYAEIKYDGERVQLHKKGNEFRYFSRSLKAVLAHKIRHFEKFIPQAFPHGKDLILDSEILMVDLQTGKPLPFGTLGVHKQSGLKDASVCLFVFDCIYYNGEVLVDKPLNFRKKVLRENMQEIKNHIMFSEMKHLNQPEDLAQMITKVMKMGLEGLVLKDTKSIYEPGKRHWLKVKKDYLFDGALADSADLIVLGAWYGTGKKGGLMSIFLMGTFDKTRNVFNTVTKVHTGHDDATLERLQTELKMIEINGDMQKVPNWLKCTKTMVPDFVAEDPKKQPVWEITGAEFTQQHDVHTANGISIRFPRVSKIRDDKTWKDATNLEELTNLFHTSKMNFDGSLFDAELKKFDLKRPNLATDAAEESPKKKLKVEQVEKVEIVNPLPVIFQNVYLFLSKEVPNDKFSNLLRLFVAFGGTILKNDGKKEEITHVLHDFSEISSEVSAHLDGQFPNSVFHITSAWLVDTVKEKKLLDEFNYLVLLLP